MTPLPTTPASPTTQSASTLNAPKAAAATSVLSSDFNTFLRMLTAQMRNQDPLEPADASQFTSQLATFSALEQQVLGNRYLEQLANRDASAAWAPRDVLGHEVVVSGAVAFDGTPIPLEIAAPPSFEARVLQVFREDGSTAARLPIPAGQNSLIWAGADTVGNDLGPGRYSFAVITGSGSTEQVIGQARLVGVAQEISRSETGAVAKLSTGQQVAIDDIVTVRPLASAISGF